ncbi:hypothetical protein ScPMuIL_006499 [Solemya velum]
MTRIQFDGIGSGLALLFKEDGKSDKTRLSIITVAPSLDYDTDHTIENGSYSRRRKWNKTNEPLPKVSYSLCLIQVNEKYKAVLSLEADIASCLSKELHRSHSYRRRFFKHVRHKIGFHISGSEDAESDCVDIFPCDHEMWMPYIVEVWVQYCLQKIDYSWCYRMEGQAAKQMLLEEAMACMSTLGGAYSALGNYFQEYAKEAGRISLKQMKIAMEIGDPSLAARCKVFLAQSFMQCGHFRICKNIIRDQYKFAISQSTR